MSIKNIIFDIGNVIVRWDPHEAIKKIFPDNDPQELYKKMYSIWIDLNLGKLSIKEAILIYHNYLKLPKKQLEELMNELKSSQKPIPGMLELLEKLKFLGFNLYAITDNLKEIIDYHKIHSDFLHYFEDIIVSANVGMLKPDKRIYKHLLDKYTLDPSESIFIDDMENNVKGAIAVGMEKSFQFLDANSCKEKLKELGVFKNDKDRSR